MESSVPLSPACVPQKMPGEVRGLVQCAAGVTQAPLSEIGFSVSGKLVV